MMRFKGYLLTAVVLMAALCPGAFAAQHHMSCEVSTATPRQVRAWRARKGQRRRASKRAKYASAR